MPRVEIKSGSGREQIDVNQELLPASEATEDISVSPEQGSEDGSSEPSEVERAEGERDALRNRLARLQADFDNARKRTERERSEFKSSALADALRSLLPVLDSFDRAMKAPVSNPRDFRSGMQLIQRQLHDALGKLGLTPIVAEGELFDPRIHEAVDVVDAPDVQDSRVVEELHPGYRLGDQLLRPAMVRVARNRPERY